MTLARWEGQNKITRKLFSNIRTNNSLILKCQFYRKSLFKVQTDISHGKALLLKMLYDTVILLKY